MSTKLLKAVAVAALFTTTPFAPGSAPAQQQPAQRDDVASLRRVIDELRKDLAAAQKHDAEQAKEIAELAKQVAALKNAPASGSISAPVAIELKSLKDALAKLQLAHSEADGKVASLNGEVTKLVAANAQSSAAAKSIQAQIDALKADLAVLKGGWTPKQTQDIVSGISTKLDAIKADVETLKAKK